MKSPVCKYVTMISWLLVSLIALDFGLGAFNQGFLLSMGFVMQNLVIFQYIVLASAVWCLYLFVKALQGQCGGCGSKKSCKC